MARFFVKPEQINENTVIITGPDVKHISHVLRMQPGRQLTVLDGQGNAYLAEITAIDKEQVTCRLLDREQLHTEPNIKITLVQGLPKGDKLESIIQKCTEIGVQRIIPLAARRSVVKLEGKKASERRERWQRVAEEAAKQCRRTVIPEVTNLSTWDEVIKNINPGALLLLPWEDEKNTPLRQVLQEVDYPGEVYIFVGPEGGFETEEVNKASAAGGHKITLGPRILRTETAGPTALAMVLYHYGEIG